MSFEISGADALLSKLKKMASYDDVKTAVKVNTAEMTTRAIREAPVDSGHLKRSIIPEVTDLVGRTKATADYAAYVNYGTRYMASRPFLTSAFTFQKVKFIDDLKRLMR